MFSKLMNVAKQQALYVTTLIIGIQLAPCLEIKLEKFHVFTQLRSVITTTLSVGRNKQEEFKYFAGYNPGRVGRPKRTGGSGARWMPQPT